MTFVPFKKICQGKCKGDRGAQDSPAVFGKVGDKRVLWCPCCDAQLIYREVDMSTGAPNIKQGITAEQKRFEDVNCGYDVVVLGGIS